MAAATAQEEPSGLEVEGYQYQPVPGSNKRKAPNVDHLPLLRDSKRVRTECDDDVREDLHARSIATQAARDAVAYQYQQHITSLDQRLRASSQREQNLTNEVAWLRQLGSAVENAYNQKDQAVNLLLLELQIVSRQNQAFFTEGSRLQELVAGVEKRRDDVATELASCNEQMVVDDPPKAQQHATGVEKMCDDLAAESTSREEQMVGDDQSRAQEHVAAAEKWPFDNAAEATADVPMEVNVATEQASPGGFDHAVHVHDQTMEYQRAIAQENNAREAATIPADPTHGLNTDQTGSAQTWKLIVDRAYQESAKKWQSVIDEAVQACEKKHKAALKKYKVELEVIHAQRCPEPHKHPSASPMQHWYNVDPTKPQTMVSYTAVRSVPFQSHEVELLGDYFDPDEPLGWRPYPLEERPEGFQKVIYAQKCILSYLPELHLEAASTFLSSEQITKLYARSFGEDMPRQATCQEKKLFPTIWTEVVKTLRGMTKFRCAAEAYADGAGLESRLHQVNYCWPPRFDEVVVDLMMSDSFEDADEKREEKYGQLGDAQQASLSRADIQFNIEQKAGEMDDMMSFFSKMKPHKEESTIHSRPSVHEKMKGLAKLSAEKKNGGTASQFEDAHLREEIAGPVDDSGYVSSDHADAGGEEDYVPFEEEDSERFEASGGRAKVGMEAPSENEIEEGGVFEREQLQARFDGLMGRMGPEARERIKRRVNSLKNKPTANAVNVTASRKVRGGRVGKTSAGRKNKLGGTSKSTASERSVHEAVVKSEPEGNDIDEIFDLRAPPKATTESLDIETSNEERNIIQRRGVVIRECQQPESTTRSNQPEPRRHNEQRRTTPKNNTSSNNADRRPPFTPSKAQSPPCSPNQPSGSSGSPPFIAVHRQSLVSDSKKMAQKIADDKPTAVRVSIRAQRKSAAGGGTTTGWPARGVRSERAKQSWLDCMPHRNQTCRAQTLACAA
ncbi:uncharacterized protein LTR77_004489 [Saxophila tyrrhenica]|uniref:Uncharacterized protein n=1 Tax=Saxophila tyrrhenica TaxID=1690608 RepID=A0AAV9PDL6_9PEZI|nr:hypothetical protein LTR77_004489 [Saxophila tyrrhenica]